MAQDRPSPLLTDLSSETRVLGKDKPNIADGLGDLPECTLP